MLVLRFQHHACSGEDSRHILEQGCDITLENVSIFRKGGGAAKYGCSKRNVSPAAVDDLLLRPFFNLLN